MKLENIHRVYMLGIGGIGMSAIAQYLKLKGKEVSGYDRTPSQVTRMLQAEGIPVYFEPGPSRLQGVDLLIYTPAVSRNHPDYQEALRLSIPIHKRSEILGMISRDQRTIAVAGTHGKTSTTGLIAHLLRNCGIDCTAFVGGISNNLGSNFVYGKSDWVVVEADEFDRSFLQLNPELAVVTSMDPDHLDIYGDKEEVSRSYREFMGRVNPTGALFLNHRLNPGNAKVPARVVTFGTTGGERRAEAIAPEGIGMKFDYVSEKMTMRGLKINYPGKYNIENALAAVSIALEAGADEQCIREGLSAFSGIQRRFDVRFRNEKVTYIDDYAHHPEEIRSLLSAVKDVFPGVAIIAAFQPHLFSRTRDFAEGFAESLSMADKVVVLEIYPAREEPIPGVTAELIYNRVSSAEKRLTGLEGLSDALNELKTLPSVVLTIGAGDIDTKVEEVTGLVRTW